MSRINKKRLTETVQKKTDDNIRLNKYIANSGLCSRREADALIQSGKVKVNNNPQTELGTIVKITDNVLVNGKKVSPQQNEYFILNKPKDYISTTKDEKGRKTVVQLIKENGNDKLFPVGRLDRNTTGILLLTNDGELTYALTHPSVKVEKVYKVLLNKPISSVDFDTLSKGIELEDSFVKPDEIAILEKSHNREIGILLHSDKNRIIRRIFEAIGYEVEALDRTSFAGLTKKNLKRGQYRKLTFREISMLKQFEKRLV